MKAVRYDTFEGPLVHRDGSRVEASGPFQTALRRAAVKATAP